MKKKVLNLKILSNLSLVPEKSDQIFTPHVGDKILKIVPTHKITHICEWASGSES